MSTPAFRGTCPSVHEPMEASDGLLVRMKPRGATLDAWQARGLARAAAGFGNGRLDLTRRANLQVRGLDADGARRFADAMVALDLANADPAIERVRNVTASPLGPADPTAAFDAHAVALAIERAFAGTPDLRALPPKFAVAVDGGGVMPLVMDRADVVVRAHPGGGMLAVPAGASRGVPCRADGAADAVVAIARTFLALASAERDPLRRVADLVTIAGEAAFLRAVGRETVVAPAAPGGSPAGQPGFHPCDGAIGAGLVVAPFARLPAAAFGALADWCELAGDGRLRVTSGRGLVVAGLDSGGWLELARLGARHGFIVDAGDPRLRVDVCAGRDGCASAEANVRGDADMFARALPDGDSRLHVSGCSKGCACPGPASITLVARAGHYDLVRGGSAADRPVVTGLDAASAAAALVTDRS